MYEEQSQPAPAGALPRIENPLPVDLGERHFGQAMRRDRRLGEFSGDAVA